MQETEGRKAKIVEMLTYSAQFGAILAQFCAII